jgi:hypothetical protein
VLDEFLPAYDHNEVHSTTASASPAAVMRAVRELTPTEVPVLVVLMAFRSIPSLLSRRRRPSPRGALIDGFERAGFFVLRDTPDELVYGVVGRFWQLSGNVQPIDPSAFAAFAEPGFAKAVFNFSLEPAGDRTRITTETRIATTDEQARRSFGRYWRVVHPGSALIRRDWLRAIRRRAERAPN